MNYLRVPLVVLLSVTLASLSLVVTRAHAGPPQGSTALERGYRTGYSDGYSAGAGDASNQAARNFENKEEYQRADRSFNDVWGPIEDYRDGYQQGYESGYNAGYDHRDFNSTIPTGLRRRQSANTSVAANPTADTGNATANNQPDNNQPDNNQPFNPGTAPAVPTNASLVIPRNTVLSLELITPLSTDVSQRNDPFKAKVLQPAQYADCIVEGRVTQVKRPGRVKGVAQLQLSFDQIRTPDNRTTGLHAELIEVVPMTADGPSKVDPEGAIKGRDSTKDDAAKIGAASGIGAIIGLIAGGGKGAAIGAVVGGGAGTAGVMTQKGHDLRLEPGQQLKIRTSADTSGM